MSNRDHEKHVAPLDGLRGWAALMVAVNHYSNAFSFHPDLLGRGAGSVGVMLFFMLSGFLMAWLYMDQPLTGVTLRAYVLRRFARVYPLFFLTASLALVLVLAGVPDKLMPIKGIHDVATYVRQILLVDPGRGVLWTIRVEIIFYAAFVGIWFFHRLVRRRRWITVAVLAVLVVWLRYTDQVAGIRFLEVSPVFLLGTILGIVLATPRGTDRNAGVTTVMAVLAVLSLPLVYPAAWQALTGRESDPWHSDLLAVQVAVLVAFAVRDRHWLAAFLGSRAMRWMGKVSYSVYLLHMFVIYAVVAGFGRQVDNGLGLPAFAVLTLLVAGLSNRFVERPLQRYALSVGARAARGSERVGTQ